MTAWPGRKSPSRQGWRSYLQAILEHLQISPLDSTRAAYTYCSIPLYEPCGHSRPPSPHQSCSRRAGAASELNSPDIAAWRHYAAGLSGVSVAIDRDDGKDSRCGYLLAVHEVRRSVERVAVAKPTPGRAPVAVRRTAAIRGLQNMVTARDRRNLESPWHDRPRASRLAAVRYLTGKLVSAF